MTLNLLDNYTARRGTVGIYVDMATLYSANDERYVASLYFQPAHRHLAAKAYHHLWERPTWRMMRLIERPLYRRHASRCQGCVKAVTSEGEAVQVCGWEPLTTRQDLRCYDLHHRHRAEVTEIALTAGEYNRLAVAQGHLATAKETKPSC
jgi:hypothetical protein